MKVKLNNIRVDLNIAGRYYQQGAIKAVCESFKKRIDEKPYLLWQQALVKQEQLLDS